jgi:hypothetical protein
VLYWREALGDLGLMRKIFNNIGSNWENVEHLEVVRCTLPLNKIVESLKKLKTIIYDHRWMFAPLNFNDKVYPLVENLTITHTPKWFYDGKKFSTVGPFEISPRLAKAFPNIASLTMDDRYLKCDFIGASQFTNLMAFKKLKSLWINFTVSPDAIPKTEDVKMLKQLLRHAHNGKIRFLTPNSKDYNFIDRLAELLEGEYFSIKSVPEIYEPKSLTININYN